MLTLAEVIDRPAQSYVYITFTVTMEEMKRPADEGFGRLFAWLSQHGIEPTGAPFYNYRRINVAETLDVEAGVPVAGVLADDGNIRFGTLPAGRFAAVDWHGHYDGLMTATAMLLGWARLVGEPMDMVEKDDGDHFACRLEIYETDPSELPDPQDWITRLAFKLRD